MGVVEMVCGGGQRSVVALRVRRAIPLLVAIGVLVCIGTASAASGDAFRPAGITAADTAVEAATALVEQRPTRVDGADIDELVVAGQARGAGGTTIVRFDQELHGVPVLGGEVVVDFALRLKFELGAGRTWVLGYSNDVMAYIPSRRVLLEGGYEGAGAMVYYSLPSAWGGEVEHRSSFDA